MTEIKVSLSLTLRGGVLLSKQECLGNSKNKKKDCYDHFRITVEDSDKKNRETLNVTVRKCRTVKQNIKLSKEAYDYMTDRNMWPDPKLRKQWIKFTKKQRLEYHCNQIAQTLGAIGFSYEILDD